MRQTNVQSLLVLTKIGYGDKLEDHDLAVIQAQFLTKA